MFESDVGLSVSFTRQCAGIGSGGGGGAPAARPRAGPAARPAGGAGGAGWGGGMNMPAGTTSADITILCGVDMERMLSHEADVFAARSSASAIIWFLVPGSGLRVQVRPSQF